MPKNSLRLPRAVSQSSPPKCSYMEFMLKTVAPAGYFQRYVNAHLALQMLPFAYAKWRINVYRSCKALESVLCNE
ncbi:hypothetical protein lerEdw1_012200 [Lerista edwardsae]|nr:hypothetical protein lerEdw1_012200 [Lerista edwardsae]